MEDRPGTDPGRAALYRARVRTAKHQRFHGPLHLEKGSWIGIDVAEACRAQAANDTVDAFWEAWCARQLQERRTASARRTAANSAQAEAEHGLNPPAPDASELSCAGGGGEPFTTPPGRLKPATSAPSKHGTSSDLPGVDVLESQVSRIRANSRRHLRLYRQRRTQAGQTLDAQAVASAAARALKDRLLGRLRKPSVVKLPATDFVLLPSERIAPHSHLVDNIRTGVTHMTGHIIERCRLRHAASIRAPSLTTVVHDRNQDDGTNNGWGPAGGGILNLRQCDVDDEWAQQLAHAWFPFSE